MNVWLELFLYPLAEPVSVSSTWGRAATAGPGQGCSASGWLLCRWHGGGAMRLSPRCRIPQNNFRGLYVDDRLILCDL
jgi:hypothetical protein